MSKIIYDLIQRFEVENGVPRLISTKIEVIEGGEDLMSLATRLLKQLGFYEKFEEKRTSQYVGYRLKNPGKGDKRYQFILSQKKEDLCISIPQEILKKHILEIEYYNFVGNYSDETDYEWIVLCRLWVLPSKKNIFLTTITYKKELQLSNVTGSCYFHHTAEQVCDQQYLTGFSINKSNLADSTSYVLLNSDTLFPYTWQASINATEILKEFISYFGQALMEQN
jgi:hypothetical protein